jgi:hypothetical protein
MEGNAASGVLRNIFTRKNDNARLVSSNCMLTLPVILIVVVDNHRQELRKSNGKLRSPALPVIFNSSLQGKAEAPPAQLVSALN